MRAPLLKVFLARYVILAEIVGYAAAFVLLACWVAFFFIRIDEHCYGSGPVSAAVLDVASPKKAVVTRMFVAEGGKVRKGQTIAELNLDGKAIAARQAQADLASLGDQILTLVDDSDKRESLKGRVASLVQDLGSIPTGTEPLKLTSPTDGFYRAEGASSRTLTGESFVGKLGEVVSERMLQVDVKLGETNRDRVKTGLPVKIRVVLANKEKHELTGTVLKKVAADELIATAEVHDPALEKYLTGAAKAKKSKPATSADAGALKAEVKVVVGNVKLFHFLFPTKSAPAGSGQGKGLWETVKGWWEKIFS